MNSYRGPPMTLGNAGWQINLAVSPSAHLLIRLSPRRRDQSGKKLGTRGSPSRTIDLGHF
jgi:hypothetical protein